MRFYLSLNITRVWKLERFDVYIGDSDPCLASNHGNLHNAGWRGSNCGYTVPGICDKRITPGWYSVKGADDKSYRQMIEGPVDMLYCGAVYPVSLQTKGWDLHSLHASISTIDFKRSVNEFDCFFTGVHPHISDGIVNRTGCLSGSQSYCQENITLQIKNCGAFYVYNLKNTKSCSSAYCFGISFLFNLNFTANCNSESVFMNYKCIIKIYVFNRNRHGMS